MAGRRTRRKGWRTPLTMASFQNEESGRLPHPRPGPCAGFFVPGADRAGRARLSTLLTPFACKSRPAAGPARPPGARQRLPQHRRNCCAMRPLKARYSPANRSLLLPIPSPARRCSVAAGRLWCPFARRLKGRMCEVSQPLRRSPTSLAVFAALKAGPFPNKANTLAGPSNRAIRAGFYAKPAPWLIHCIDRLICFT